MTEETFLSAGENDFIFLIKETLSRLRTWIHASCNVHFCFHYEQNLNISVLKYNMCENGAVIPRQPWSAHVHGIIKHGDLCVLFDRHDLMKMITIESDGVYRSKNGTFKMSDWIGKEYGTRLLNEEGKHVFVIRPTPEIWTLVLKHRTQVLYVSDISMIVFKLELKPGSIVLETGTGTGSLTTSLARAVAPQGRVATFEFHQERADLAKRDFQMNGIDHVIDVECRDTQTNGFPETFHGKADAVFLDIPSPWLAVKSAAACLKPNRMICSFSPCIEQVQRTCEEINFYGFKDIETIEILVREHLIVKDSSLSAIDLLYIQQDRVARARKVDKEEENTSETVISENKKRKFEPESSKDNAMEKEGDAKGRRMSRSTTSKPVFKSRGHTGYLTFARKSVAYREIPRVQ